LLKALASITPKRERAERAGGDLMNSIDLEEHYGLGDVFDK